MWAIFLGMRLVMTLAFDMLSSSLAQTSAVVALRDWPSFLVDMDERAIFREMELELRSVKTLEKKFTYPDDGKN